MLAARWDRIIAKLLDGVALPVVIFALAGLFGGDRGLESSWLLLLPVAGANEIIGTAVWGQTVGKRLLGLRVVRADTYGTPGWRRALLRVFGLTPLGLLPYGGVAGEAADDASFLFSKSRRALHDVISGTIVVEDGPWRAWAMASGSHSS